MSKQKKQEENSMQSSATVVDGKLILTLPTAMTPVVWQMDMDQAKSAALEVQEDKKRKAFCLMLRNTKGETIEVAPFEDKAQAVQALMMTSQALQGAHGKIRPQTVMQMPYANTMMAQPQMVAAKKGSKWGGILAIGLILVLLIIWIASLPRAGESFVESAEQAVAGSGAPAQQAGVPVSADEFLSQQ